MSNIVNKYPYTDLHSVNLDYILKLVRENAGLHLEESGNQILLKTADNTIVSAITAPYATSAGSANTASSASYAATAGSSSSATYATSAGTAATATNATNAANATKADFATSAGSATSADNATYATSAGTAATATNATHAASADFATTTGNVEHADNAFEKFELNGNYLKFTTYDGTVTELAAPYAVKASRDSSANFINQTYVANVVDNNGTLEFKNAQGNTIVSLIPSVTQAVTDSYGNTIADYVKSVSVESGSNYVTIDHGTGTAETLQIPYSDTAWKDTNGNVIKNTYVKRLEIITDPNDGHKKLVAYNGDNPEAELFRIPVEAYYAQTAGEANHAASADYATNAGSAATSTGSVSSITRNRTLLTIENGDGTSSTVDLFINSQRYLWVKQSINNNTELLDPSFTVGHSEEFGVDNYNTVWGFDTAFKAMAEGAKIDYIDANSYGLFSSFAQKGFALDNGDPYSTYQIFVFDTTAGALKCFEITPPADDELTPGNITITRLM